MNDHTAALLAALSGASSQHPKRRDQVNAALLVADLRLTDADLDRALGQLESTRQIVSARVGADPQHLNPVWWPTGIPAQLPSGITIGKHTVADAAANAIVPRAADADYGEAAARATVRAARIKKSGGNSAALAELARSRRLARAAASIDVAQASPPASFNPAGETPAKQEPTMPRLTAPAKPRDAGDDARATQEAALVAQASPPASPSKHASHLRDSINRGNGVLQHQILAALMDATREEPMTVARIHVLSPAAASRDSVSVTLRTLAKRGLVDCDSRVEDARRVNVYWLTAPAATLNDGHEANIAAGRRLVTDEEHHEEPAIIPGDWEPEPEQTPPADDIAYFPGESDPVAQALNLDHPGVRFALWDTGDLLITHGDEMLSLGRADTLRLATYLHGVSGALFDESASAA